MSKKPVVKYFLIDSRDVSAAESAGTKKEIADIIEHDYSGDEIQYAHIFKGTELPFKATIKIEIKD